MRNRDDAILSTSNKKQYYIPMEVTAETIQAYGLKPEDVIDTKIGNRRVKAVMIPTNQETYLEYMRPLWREEKKKDRNKKCRLPNGKRCSKDCNECQLQKQGSELSIEAMAETTGIDIESPLSLEDDVIKKELYAELHMALGELEELDRKIMQMFSEGKSERFIGEKVSLSQRAVGKKKKKCLEILRSKIEKYI